MKTVQLLFLLLFTCMFSMAQQLEGVEGQTNLQMLGGSSMTARTFDARYQGVDGYPTLFEKFVTGVIETSDGKKVKCPQINYDVYADEVIVVQNRQELIISNELVKSFILNNGITAVSFIKHSIESGKTGYYQVLVDGDFQLLKKNLKTFLKADYQGAYSADRRQDEFKDNADYYFLTEEGKLMELKNKKSIVKAIPGEAERIEKFIKVNQIDVSTELGLLRLFQHLNTNK